MSTSDGDDVQGRCVDLEHKYSFHCDLLSRELSVLCDCDLSIPASNMTTPTKQQSHDLLGLDDSEQSRGWEEKQASINGKLETGLDRAETEPEADDSKFAPTKVYWIQSHVMGSKEIAIVNVTGQVSIKSVDGKNVDDEFREAAKQVGTAKDAAPAFRFTKKHWYNKSYKAYVGTDDSNMVAEWRHPTWSTGTAELDFPAGSKHCPHNLAIKPISWKRRSAEFVLESVPFTWRCDDKYKSNRMTLSKRVAGVESTIARYSQKWSAW